MTPQGKEGNDHIARRAHQMWEEAGRPDGQSDSFWHQAELELRLDRQDSSAIGAGASAQGFVRDVTPPGEDGAK